MAATAKALIPRPVRGFKPQSEMVLSLDDLLTRTETVDLKQIRQLSRFLAVIVVIPESCVQGERLRDAVALNRSTNQTPQPAKIVGIPGRVRGQLITPEPHGEFLFGRVRVNFREMVACRDGEPVALTAMEFKVLAYLIHNARRVISRDELLDRVWGYENYPCTRTVDNHILKLRQKLEQHPSEPVHIRTVHATGYKFLP